MRKEFLFCFVLRSSPIKNPYRILCPAIRISRLDHRFWFSCHWCGAAVEDDGHAAWWSCRDESSISALHVESLSCFFFSVNIISPLLKRITLSAGTFGNAAFYT